MIAREKKCDVYPRVVNRTCKLSIDSYLATRRGLLSRKTVFIWGMVWALSVHLGFFLKPAKAQVTPTAIAKSICPEQLEAVVNAVTNRPQFNRMRWGILVKNLTSNQTLYSQDAQKYFNPASTAKLLTTAAVLKQLSANFRFRTSVYRSKEGYLHVVGRGDPSLTDVQLTALAKQLKQKGIWQVKQLIIDDSYVRGEAVNPSWQWEDINSDYGAPINSFILNQNVVSIQLLPQTVGKPLQIVWNDRNEAKQWYIINQSVTVPDNPSQSINITRDSQKPILQIQGHLAVNSEPETINLPVLAPAEYFLQHLRSALAVEKIIVVQAYVSTHSGEQEQELAAVESPQLSQLVAQTNLISDNLFAEALLRAIAINKPIDKNQTSADAGLRVMKTTLTSLGVDPTSYFLVDGSGLSRKNLVSPEALVQTLQGMAQSPLAFVYQASLPIAGRSGTLKNRFLNTPAQGIVQAKTGTMDGVVALAGYVNSPQYQPLAFSIIVNQINQLNQSIQSVRQAIDEIVLSLAKLQRC